jgi:hypothetical protein
MHFKSIKFLNELSLDSIDIKAQSLIDKYMKHHEILDFKTLSEFVVNYNLNEKDFKMKRTLIFQKLLLRTIVVPSLYNLRIITTWKT